MGYSHRREEHSVNQYPSGREPEHRPVPEKPICYRIKGVPNKWSRNDLVDALATLLNGQTYDIVLYPDCLSSRKTALLISKTKWDYLKNLEEEKHEILPSAHLVIDSHFHGLTPLNDHGPSPIVEYALMPFSLFGSHGLTVILVSLL